MTRDKWVFEYGADVLMQAAAEKVAHHRSRLKWWEEKRDAVMKVVRESGIDISESVAAEYQSGYSNKSGRFGPQITIDATLQSKLVECHGKLLEHNEKISDYEGWRQMLEANSKARLLLDQSDWMFFFGK